MSEAGAHAALVGFVSASLRWFHTRSVRFRADIAATSEISPFVRFGQLSVFTVIEQVVGALGESASPTYLRRLCWRDLAYWALDRFPHLPDLSFRPWYEAEVWAQDPQNQMLKAWQRGRTGYPLVDAAMQQLWRVGWMPNYMRHIVAGFLVEYLHLDWRLGELWFHDTLVDADVAINAYMWQNGGHSGMDQWNFVMHPVFAAKNCDPEGEYVRWFLPELANLPIEYIHCPWEAPMSVLAGAGVVLGRDYPKRILTNLDHAQQSTLEAVLNVRSANPEVLLRSGHERLVLDNGNTAVLITRKDYHAQRVLTKMTPGEAWDRRTRVNKRDPCQVAMLESVSAYMRNGSSCATEEREVRPKARPGGMLSAKEARTRRINSRRRVHHIVSAHVH